jgi:two-component system response regulator YesN
LQDIANHFNLSPSYINRLIKHKYNKSPMKYYMALKIEEAKKLISNNKELPIKDISDSLGFYDQHYFSRVFKSYVGMSPVKYKDTLK